MNILYVLNTSKAKDVYGVDNTMLKEFGSSLIIPFTKKGIRSLWGNSQMLGN